jgi:SAM-dependent methyltransferase
VKQESVLDHLENNPDSYDLITGYDIVEHFNKDEVLRFLDGCFSALQPGGRLILQTPNADSPWGNSLRYGDFTHEVCFNPNSLIRLLRLVGFGNLEIREAGPVPYGNSLTSMVRSLIWQVIRAGLRIWNLAETGSSGTGVWTRVFLISGIKK